MDPRAQTVTDPVSSWPGIVVSVRGGLAIPSCAHDEIVERRSGLSMKSMVKALRDLNWRQRVSETMVTAMYPELVSGNIPNQGKFIEILTAINFCPWVQLLIPTSDPACLRTVLRMGGLISMPASCIPVAILDEDREINSRRIAELSVIKTASRGLYLTSSSSLPESPLDGISFAIVPGLDHAGGSDVQLAVSMCEAAGIEIRRLKERISNEGETPFEIDIARDSGPVEGESPVDGSSPVVRAEEPPTPALVSRKQTSSSRRKKANGNRRSRPTNVSAQTLAHQPEAPLPVSVEALPSSDPEGGPKTALFHTEVPAIIDRDARSKFEEHDAAVRRGIKASVEAWFALLVIRDEELWRAGGYRNWNTYCDTLVELSRSYVNKLIRYAELYQELEEDDPPKTTEGMPILPCRESLSRPLKRLPSRKERVRAWRKAVKIAGGMPTEKIVAEVVAKMRAAGSPPEPKPMVPRERRRAAFAELRDAFDKGLPRDEIVNLLNRLETLI